MTLSDDSLASVLQVQRALEANDSWVVSPRRAKRVSGEGSTGEHIMDIVKDLVERSLGETELGRRSDACNPIADFDADEPNTPSGSPTRSTTRPVEVTKSRSTCSKFQQVFMCQPSVWLLLSNLACSPLEQISAAGDAEEGGGGATGAHEGMSSPVSPRVALARSLSEQERLRRANAEAQAQLAWSEGDAIAHELREIAHEIDTAGRTPG